MTVPGKHFKKDQKVTNKRTKPTLKSLFWWPIMVMLVVSCGHRHVSQNRTGSVDSTSQFSIAGTWKNSQCTAVIWDKDYDGNQTLWYHETLTIDDRHLNSVNRYFMDANCTQLDSYQPDSSGEPLLSYTVGESVAPGIYKIDLVGRHDPIRTYSVVSVRNNTLIFGAPKNDREDGKSDATRFSDLGSRIFHLEK